MHTHLPHAGGGGGSVWRTRSLLDIAQDTVTVCLLKICSAVLRFGKVFVVCILVYITAGILFLTELQRSGNGKDE